MQKRSQTSQPPTRPPPRKFFGARISKSVFIAITLALWGVLGYLVHAAWQMVLEARKYSRERGRWTCIGAIDWKQKVIWNFRLYASSILSKQYKLKHFAGATVILIHNVKRNLLRVQAYIPQFKILSNIVLDTAKMSEYSDTLLRQKNPHRAGNLSISNTFSTAPTRMRHYHF